MIFLFEKTIPKMKTNPFELTRIKLEKIPRYHRIPLMLYRSNVFLHELRVLALIQELTPFLIKHQPGLNIQHLCALAITHDDSELVNHGFNDPHMPPDPRYLSQKNLASQNGRYNFKLDDFPALELHSTFQKNNILEAQVIHFADSFDGMGESMHEVLAGNNYFSEPLNAHINNLITKRQLPYLLPFLEKNHPFFDIPVIGTPQTIRNFHTTESLNQPSNYDPYDFWVQALKHSNNSSVQDSLLYLKKRSKSK